MKMTKAQLQAFAASRGAFSVVTAREDVDGQLTFDKAEKAVFFSVIPRSRVIRGPIQGREAEAGINVILYHGRRVAGAATVYVTHPKKKGNELRLYFREGGFNPSAYDIWYVILREADGKLGIGWCDIDTFLQATGALPKQGRDAESQESGSGEPTTVAPVPRAKRQISARRGQPGFRKALLERFDMQCCVTGSKVIHVLEAAHISTIPGMDDHRAENGLLLRSDVHTLHDLGLLALDPDNLRIHTASVIARSEYAKFRGKRLTAPAHVAAQIDRESLRQRWERFTAVKKLLRESTGTS